MLLFLFSGPKVGWVGQAFIGVININGALLTIRALIGGLIDYTVQV